MAHLSLTAEGERRLTVCLLALDNDGDELELVLSAATRRMRPLDRSP